MTPDKDVCLTVGLALSAAIQVVVSPLTVAWIAPIRNDLGSHTSRIAIWFFVTVLALPLVAGVGVARATDLLFDPTQDMGPRQPVRRRRQRRRAQSGARS